jgi:hypothetical protein
MLTKRDRIIRAIKGEKTDKIPWTYYRSLLPWGSDELKFRSLGLTPIYEGFPACNNFFKDVEIIDRWEYELNNNYGENIIKREFKTPVGKVSNIFKHKISDHPQLSDIPSRFNVSDIAQRELSWISKYPFEDESDYNIIEYVYEHAHNVTIDDEFIKTEKIIGDEGIIMLNGGRSPFSLIMFSLMGYEKCYLEYHSNKRRFLKLFELLYEKSKEYYILASKSSAYIVWCPDNITSDLIPPYIFKEFFIPFYNEVGEILHKENKVLAVHMDGNLKILGDLIKETEIDIIEAMTPPPLGDFSIREAREKLKEKVFWINFPGNLFGNLDSNGIKRLHK